MAESKVKEIKDERVLNAVRAIQKESPETKDWTPEKQAVLIWYLIKTNPQFEKAFKAISKEDNQKAYDQWMADWNNGRLAYPSNTARSLALAKLAAPPKSDEFKAGDAII